MIITSLDRRRGHLYRLELDDGRELLLDRDTVEQSPYGVDSEIDEEALAALIEDSAVRRAREYALYLISLRDYSEWELKRKLREKGHTEKAAETAARMVELGLVNDEVYARRLARDCRLRKLYGHRRAVQELCAKGVRREIAVEAVEAVEREENVNDLQQALALLEKKRYNSSVTDSERQRGTALLMRYGYDSYTVRQAWRQLEETEYTDAGE